jgi:hypothetical protein
MRLRRPPVTGSTAVAVAALLAGCGTHGHGSIHPGARASTTAPAHAAPTSTGAEPNASTATTSTAAATRSTAATTRTTAAKTAAASTTAGAPPSRLHRPGGLLTRVQRVGRLPQTMTLPSPHTRVFHAEMRALWAAVRRARPALGLPAFFPADAYVQVKTIYDAREDWRARLVGDFDLDVRAAHGLLGSRPSTARLIRVSVPMADAHWVPPGVCDNRVGYYELPNARMVYGLHGAVHSFGIASMISWRGLWFVVHLGAILRSSDTGQVDAPSAGPGVSVPSSTC